MGSERPQTMAEFLAEAATRGQLAAKSTEVLAAKSIRRARRSGVLAGKLAAGVTDLLASNPKAPEALQQLAAKSVINLLASNPKAVEEFNLAASQFQLAAKLSDQLGGKSRSGLSRKGLHGLMSRKGGTNRAAKLSPEKRREIALLGVEARRQKQAAKTSAP